MDINSLNFDIIIQATQEISLLKEENGLLVRCDTILDESKQQQVIDIISNLFLEYVETNLAANLNCQNIKEVKFLQLIDGIRKMEKIFGDHYPADAPIVQTLKSIHTCTEDLAKSQVSSLIEHIDNVSNPTYSNMQAWSINTFWNLISVLTTTVNNTAIIVSDAVKTNLLNDNHPWKQKKYEFALHEFKAGFTALSLQEPEDLISLLESDHIKENSPLKSMLLDILKKMVRPSIDYRRTYYQTLTAFRVALKSQEFENALIEYTVDLKQEKPVDITVKMLLQLCESRFCHVHLYTFCEQLVDKLIEQANDSRAISLRLENEDFDAIKLACYSSMGAVRASVEKGRLQGWANINFDPAMQQNIPFVFADIPLANLNETSIKMIRFIRMGCPTIEGYIHKACVGPEYIYFLLSQRLQDKSHLYISLQSDLPALAGDETERNRVCRELQENHANFFFIVLDQDTDFYRQEGAFAKLTYNEFISIFKERLFGINTGYDFPINWKQNSMFIKGISGIFDITAEIIFMDLDAPDVQQRCDFIEIFQALLILFCVRFSNVDSVNVTCKDAIDRAMKTLSLLMQVIITAQGNAENPTYQKIHKVCTHAPAFLVKKQPIIDNRRSRLMSAFTLLNRAHAQASIIIHAKTLGISGNSFNVIQRPHQKF